MTNTKRRASCKCNGDFLSIVSDIWCGGRSTSFAKLSFYHAPYNTQDLIGQAAIKALLQSKELTNVESKDVFTVEKISERHKERINYIATTYNYKTENAIYQNMMSCSISDDGEKIEISPWSHKKSDVFEGLDEKHNILISSESPPEIIGAALKFAFTRCKGKGIEVVTKALFPDGVPNSLEEYLESVNKDYKKWLISC